MLTKYDVVVVGGGPAGLAAASGAKDTGAERVLIIERDAELGGILNQCIHNGFGLHHFGEELTGPEYAARCIDELSGRGIDVALDTMVLEITPDRRVRTLSAAGGAAEIGAGAVVLAMGCRERTRGALAIPGSRPAGIFTAGAAQRMINIDGWSVGRRVVIVGSGDIGLIMARRLTLEGAQVLACVEIMPYSSGLSRNIVQCLEDYDIPLYLSHTVLRIEGYPRVEKVVVAEVDEDRRPVPGTEFEIRCDTVLLSVGLIPENELSRQAGVAIDDRTGGPAVDSRMETSVPGIYACGNVVHVHDLADYVTQEGYRAGRAAGAAAAGTANVSEQSWTEVVPASGIRYTVPQRVRSADEDTEIFFRVSRPVRRGRIVVKDGDREILSSRRQYLSPGEMQQILLPAESLRDVQGGTMSVSVVEEGAP